MTGRAALTLFLAEDAPDPAQTPQWRGRVESAGRLKITAAPGYARAAALCALFGVSTPADEDVPVGAIAAADDLPASGGAWWVRADPVTLVAAGAQLRLAAAGAAGLTSAQAHVLTRALEEQQVLPGARWYAPAPARWYVALPEPALLRTAPPAPWVGRDVEDALPQGPHASRWRAALNAAQMVLHAAAAQAEASGDVASSATSVWLWGAGTRPSVPQGRFEAVIAGDALARGLARLSGATAYGSDAAARWDALHGAVLQVADTAEDGAAARDALGARQIDTLMLVHAPWQGPVATYRVRSPRRWWKPWTR